MHEKQPTASVAGDFTGTPPQDQASWQPAALS